MNEYKTKALEIISAWNALDGNEQRDFCRNCVARSIREGRKLKPGNEIDDAMTDAVACHSKDCASRPDVKGFGTFIGVFT